MLHEETLSNATLRPTHLTIDLGKVTHNYLAIQNKAKQAKVMFILKANAYGHGLLRIAQHLQSLSVDYLGVAYLEEGILLRQSGIKTPILVLGGITGNQIPLFIQHDLTITASSIDKLNQIEESAKKLGKKALAHLKIDTGMERIGVHYYSATKILEASLKCKHTHIEGIYTHLANADNLDLSYTSLQVKRFRKVLNFYKDKNEDCPMVHVNNSGGLLQNNDFLGDMVRIGILLYGVYPSLHLEKHIDIRPVMTWKTRVVYFKVIKSGHPVSYGSAWQSETDSRIVTLPVGYGDGYMRAMSNKAQVIIRGNRFNTVGNICMDQMMINIGSDTAYNGDEVVLIGQQGNEQIRVEDLANWANTIPYEIMTNINTRVPRVYVNNRVKEV